MSTVCPVSMVEDTPRSNARTKFLTEFGCPKDRVEFDLAHSVRALIDDLDCIVKKLVLPMSKKYTIHLRYVSVPVRMFHVAVAQLLDYEAHRINIPLRISLIPAR